MADMLKYVKPLQTLSDEANTLAKCQDCLAQAKVLLDKDEKLLKQAGAMLIFSTMFLAATLILLWWKH